MLIIDIFRTRFLVLVTSMLTNKYKVEVFIIILYSKRVLIEALTLQNSEHAQNSYSFNY